MKHPRTGADRVDPGPFAPSRNRALPLLRPPGAIEETRFLDLCTSCGDCWAACPYGAIRPAPARLRGAAGTPILDPIEQPCWSCPDSPCIRACGTGALGSSSMKLGTARIQEQTCLAHQGGFCSSCVERCPVPGAIEVDRGRPTVVEELCTGCGVCQYVCPSPQNAILLMPMFHRPNGPRHEGEVTT